MLKKQFAIFTLVVFFLAQFGRMINFCLCTMSAYQQTKTFTCDCERQLFAAVKTDNNTKDQAPQHISSQQPSEELFHLPNFPSFAIQAGICFTAWPKTGNEQLHYVFGKKVFRPPLHVS